MEISARRASAILRKGATVGLAAPTSNTSMGIAQRILPFRQAVFLDPADYPQRIVARFSRIQDDIVTKGYRYATGCIADDLADLLAAKESS